MKTGSVKMAVVATVLLAAPFAQALKWIDVSTDRSVEVDGLAWFKANGGQFIRLPLDREDDIKNGTDLYVWGNGQYPSTARVRFRTDSTSLHLKIDHGGARLAMWHMASIAVSGIDLYIGAPGNESFWNPTRPLSGTNEYEHAFFDGMPKQMREFTLYLPTYSKLKTLKIGIDEDATIVRPTPYKTIKPVVVYGTSITQGACSSRCSNGYVAQLGRRLNCDMVNLGFSGSGRAEPIMADLMLEIDASAYIVDCVANMDADLMNERYEAFVNRLRAAKPNIPIILMTKPHYAEEIVEGTAGYDAQNAALFTTYSNRLAAGDQNIYLFDTGALIPPGGDHPSADGTHLTDEGFTRITDHLEPVLRQILQGVESPPPTFIPIGDTNNVADPQTGYGAVHYAYAIAEKPVTIEQFYYSGVGNGDEDYWNDGTRMVGWDAPATMVTWNEAAKYCNWLTSGSPTNGAYQFDATGSTLVAVDRDAALATYGTVYALPTEDEWYKAAYYTGSGYSLYPFGTDDPPRGGTNENPQANIKEGTYVNPSPNYAWKVGSGAMEQNGTYDMAGNAFEWIESAADGTLDDMAENRVMRGGSWYYNDYYTRSTTRTPRDPSVPSTAIEFRPVRIGAQIDSWSASHGLSGSDATASADPDGDRLDNLGEYGLGGDPTNPVDQGIPPVYTLHSAEGTGWITYVYPKRSNLDSGLSYCLEICTNLSSGVWIDSGYSVVGTGTINDEFDAITNQIPTEPERKKYVRLVIEG